MGQVLHGGATTTEAIRRAIQNRPASLRAYGINQKTVARWKTRTSEADLPTGPKKPEVDSVVDRRGGDHRCLPEAYPAAARRLPLFLAGYYPASDPIVIASLSAASPDFEVARGCWRQAGKEEVQVLPDRLFPHRHREVQTAEGKLYLYVAIDRTSKFAFVQLVRKTGSTSASAFLVALIAAVPYKIHIVLTDNGIQFTLPPRYADGPTARHVIHMFDAEKTASSTASPGSSIHRPMAKSNA